MFYYENKLKKQGYNFIIGVDEAGRGPLAGPVVAAAVALKTRHFRNRIDDSKKLSPSAREKAYQEITRKSFFGIGIVSESLIDKVNILQASRIAMENAVLSLLGKINSDNSMRVHLIVDGDMDLNTLLPYKKIIRGDSKSKSIASASIIAKVTRDNIMKTYDVEYPEYGFIKHKGYPTQEHRAVLRRIGLSPIHRKTFCCV